MSATFIREATNKKLTGREVWPGQKNHHNTIDVSLCAGQTIPPGQDNAQFSAFAEHLDAFNRNLASIFPFISFAEKHFLHSTLLTLFNGSKTKFNENKNDLIQLSKEVIKDFAKYGPLTIQFQETALTPNGSVILLGASQGLVDFRNEIYSKYDTPEDLRKNIIHITLGRLLQEESAENMSAVNDFLTAQGFLSLPSITIDLPKIIVSSDALCLNFDSNLSLEFNSPVKLF